MSMSVTDYIYTHVYYYDYCIIMCLILYLLIHILYGYLWFLLYIVSTFNISHVLFHPDSVGSRHSMQMQSFRLGVDGEVHETSYVQGVPVYTHQMRFISQYVNTY